LASKRKNGKTAKMGGNKNKENERTRGGGRRGKSSLLLS